VQNGSEEPYEAVAGCGARLGESSDLYGSAEVARDIDAVRAALGVSQFDFYGGSYAGVDIQAYAARFPGSPPRGGARLAHEDRSVGSVEQR
jgi:pimeloyl-ACP methyl ester carboxylesterase